MLQKHQVLGAALGFATLALISIDATAASADSKFAAASTSGVPNRYIVILKTPEELKAAGLLSLKALPVKDAASGLAARHGGKVGATWEHALQGFAVEMTEAKARRLAQNPRVRLVEQEVVAQASAASCPGSTPGTATPYPTSPQLFSWPTESNWGLDRIDQRALPRDNSYSFTSTGVGVHAYILDTGVAPHEQFRATAGFGPSRLGTGRNFVHHEPRLESGLCIPPDFTEYAGDPLYIDPLDTFDDNGHGTHVAGIAGGRWFGVAKEVTLHPVRIASSCGFTSTARVLSGIEWIHTNAVKPAVVNFSFNLASEVGGCNGSVATAFRSLLTQRGILTVNSAGNNNTEASNFVPTCVTELLAVGATTAADQRWGPASSPTSSCSGCGSNWGAFVDVFAPGGAIVSAANANSTGVCERTGTSMAAPHVTGVAALYLQRHPLATPADVHAAVVNGATAGALTGDLGGSANRLLYSLIDLP